MPEQRPSLLQRVSDSLLPQDALNARYTMKTATESIPLPRNRLSNPSPTEATTNPPQSVLRSPRHRLARAATAAEVTTRSTVTENSPTPILSRRSLNRATTVAGAVPLILEVSTEPAISPRPSLLRWATNVLVASLTLNTQAARRDDDEPGTPTFWSDHIHRQPLLQIWDGLPHPEVSDSSMAQQLTRVERGMLRRFGELGFGEVVLTDAWIKYVLGVCLRPPFCEGRWQKLATAAGPRGNWGPW